MLLGLHEDWTEESPGQGDAMPPVRSWLLRPVARSPQRCRDKAESQGGSEEAGLGAVSLLSRP